MKLWEIQGSQDKPLPKESFVSASQESVFEYDHWFVRFFQNEYKPGFLKTGIIRLRHRLNQLTKNF